MAFELRSAGATVFAETVGTLGLLSAVSGSGIMAERLSQGNEAVALMANALASACALFVLIRVFAPLSGAHFNPLISCVQCLRGEIPWSRLPGYVVGQFVGAVLGVVLANGMFDLPLWEWSVKTRACQGLWISECVAAAALVLVVLRSCAAAAPANVAAYIGAAYWFTSSTSFANPAATFGRMFTNTFSGIAPSSVAAFVLVQGLGALLGLGVFLLMERMDSRLAE